MAELNRDKPPTIEPPGGYPHRHEAVVLVHAPASEVSWQTVGGPSLLVIWSYRMGFEIEERRNSSCLRVSIEYALSRR